jgi:hypothetical protein
VTDILDAALREHQQIARGLQSRVLHELVRRDARAVLEAAAEGAPR